MYKYNVFISDIYYTFGQMLMDCVCNMSMSITR